MRTPLVRSSSVSLRSAETNENVVVVVDDDVVVVVDDFVVDVDVDGAALG